MKKTLFAALFILILVVPSALAIHNSGHIYLLAVAEGQNGTENDVGSVADLYLEVKPGSGRVFIDTYPLTKLDTQFSTRFAKQIACDYLDKDCSGTDFFYTIRSQSSIVGGPSAGAAMTLLTISVLSDNPLPKDLAVTGTINSGGLIGPVGGVKAKVQAAQREGLSMVVIPAFSIGNQTELEEYLNYTSLRVIKASSIDQALFELTGKKKETGGDIIIDPKFTEIMKGISEELCGLTKEIIVNGTNTTEEIRGKELYGKSINATQEGTFYAAASYCFGANVQFRRLDMKNKTDEELVIVLSRIKRDIENLDKETEARDIATLNDLQTYMIVKERIIEANDYILEIESSRNYSNISSDDIAYSIERYNSAISWSKFFGSGTKEYNIDKTALQETCLNKIEEAQSYLQYISLYTDLTFEGIEEELELAREDYDNERFELCIYKASKAKAESSLVIEAISIPRDQLLILVEQKLELAKNNIINVQEKGVFPIVGYSYYEYANSLKQTDPDSALLYSGYSTELSNLEVYFEKQPKIGSRLNFDFEVFSIFVFGAIVGVVATLIAVRHSFKHKKNKR